MAALLHPDSLPLPGLSLPGLSLLGLDPEALPTDALPSTARPSARSTAAAPWNAPSFLGATVLPIPASASADPIPGSEPMPTHQRPELRLIIGGLDATPAPRRWLRALLGGLALALLVALAAIGARNLLGADAAASGPASSAAVNHPVGAVATSTTPTAPTEVVVQPGDTIWSIARRLHPTGEIRGVVDALQQRAGGASLTTGQQIDVRGLVAD